MGRWGAWGIVLLVAAVALPAATVLGKGGEAGPIDEKATSCWPCHKDWANQNLKSFYDILPPPEAGAAVGQQFDYVVQLQNPWLQEVIFVEPALDLSNAPSLTFAGGPEPKVGVQIPGSIPVQPKQPAIPPDPSNPFGSPDGFVTFSVPVGITSLHVKLTPGDTTQTGPTLHLKAYQGVNQPTGAPTKDAKAGGPGQSVEVDLPAAGGNWTIEAVADQYTDLGAPKTGTSVPFIVTFDAKVDTAGKALLKQPQTVDVKKHSSFLFTFGLKAVKEPQPGETVRILVNGTMYYLHDLATTDDYANITKEGPKPLNVVMANNRVTVQAPADGGFPVVQPQNGATMDKLSEIVGYASAFLLISSIWTGGMFGKASRRQLNGVFGSAKRRVAFHNFLSYGILLAASAHTVLFIIETAFYWTLGVLWGGLAILSMFGLGITGAWQVGMIRRWNYGVWRWSHYGLAVAAILFTLVHMALDGVHFAFVQEALHWHDPLDPRKGIH
jgi:hypothetical protein